MILENLECVLLVSAFFIIVSRKSYLFYLVVILTVWIEILTYQKIRFKLIGLKEIHCKDKYKLNILNTIIEICWD